MDLKKLTLPYLIADIGINHNGDMNNVKKLIDAVHCCGWNCTKFQKRTPDLIPEEMKNKKRITPWGELTYYEYKKKIELSLDNYFEIEKYISEKQNVDWTASVWDIDSIHFMRGFKNSIPFIKIPSALITKTDLLKQIAELFYDKYIIMSTGMCNDTELDIAVNTIFKITDKLILMHTNSCYPSNYEELNLKMIITLKERYGFDVGYSGHEIDINPSVVAYMLGAKIIERHITLNHRMWGTDQSSSLEVSGMNALKTRLVDTDIVMGDGIKKITKNEMKKRIELVGNIK